MGNTGLAIYYPTKQLVPIINFTAQGSASGSTSAKNLGNVDSSKTESIEVAVARQTAVGSSLGATFEPTVLLGLRPDIRSRDTQTIDHLEAAAFGSTYGAILGIELNPNLAEAFKFLSGENSNHSFIFVSTGTPVPLSFSYSGFTILLILSLGYYFEITKNEWIIHIILIGFILTTEALNTVAEKICDYINPKYDDRIKLIKDISCLGLRLKQIKT